MSKRFDKRTIEEALRLKKQDGTRIVLDICDNRFFYKEDTSALAEHAAQLRSAATSMDAIVASTHELADVIRKECPESPAIYIVGDAVEPPFIPEGIKRFYFPISELRLYALAARLRRDISNSTTRLLWFGNHGSPNADGGMNDLLRIKKALLSVTESQRISLTVISNNRAKFHHLTRGWPFPCFYLPWAISTFSRAAYLHDIAIVPISQNPFTVCKTNNRVATALVHELAVVADSIPSYRELADTIVLDDWGTGFRQLCEDASLRASMTKKGRELVLQNYSQQILADTWRETFESIRRGLDA